MALLDAAARVRGLRKSEADRNFRPHRASYPFKAMSRWAALLVTLAIVFGAARAPAGEIFDPGELAAKFRSPVTNPYCDIPTFAVLKLVGQARAILETDGKPLILIDVGVMETPPYARFLLAHECCHHMRGHLLRLRRQQLKRKPRKAGPLDPQTAMTFMADHISHRKIEMDADCCAARLLARRGDRAGLDAAAAAMAAFGVRGTGGAYPAGWQRAVVIRSCGGLR
jgi:small basic protein